MHTQRLILFLMPLALAVGVALWLWLGGGVDRLAIWAADGQREAQNAIARAVRAIRQGEGGALFGLLSLSFLYGLFHAAGPGHGKLLISGYGLGRPVAALRLAGLALASSLAQSLTAVVMVVAGIGLLNWSRTQVTDAADGVLSLASYLAVAGVGLWLAVRGVRGLVQSRAPHTDHGSRPTESRAAPIGPPSDRRGPPLGSLDVGEGSDAMTRGVARNEDHGHTHPDHSHDHAHCTHSHGPTPEEAAKVRSLRDALVLIGAVAIRPCTGALFLLIVTWRMEILPAGIAGAFAMGLGTASVTVLAALASVWLRRSSLDRLRASLPDPLVAARLAAVTELAVGALVCFVALSLALRLI